MCGCFVTDIVQVEQLCLQPKQQAHQRPSQGRAGIPGIRGVGLAGSAVWRCQLLGWSGCVSLLMPFIRDHADEYRSMPGDGAIPLLGDSYWGYELSRSVLNGSIPVDRLNDMVCSAQALIVPVY